MGRPNINVSLDKRLLSVDGNDLRLDDSFFYAGITRLEADKDRALELKYCDILGDHLVNETERIYGLLSDSGLETSIIVNYFFEDVDFPTISLMGSFRVNVEYS